MGRAQRHAERTGRRAAVLAGRLAAAPPTASSPIARRCSKRPSDASATMARSSRWRRSPLKPVSPSPSCTAAWATRTHWSWRWHNGSRPAWPTTSRAWSPPPRPRSTGSAASSAATSATARDRHLYLYVTAGGASDDRVRQSLLLADGAASQFAASIQAYRSARGADPTVATVWAYGMVGALHFVTLWWLRDQALDVELVTDQITALLWSGLELDQEPRSTKGTR